MGLFKEMPRPETGKTFSSVNPRSSETEANIFSTKETGAESRIRELSHLLFVESKEGEKKKINRKMKPRGQTVLNLLKIRNLQTIPSL